MAKRSRRQRVAQSAPRTNQQTEQKKITKPADLLKALGAFSTGLGLDGYSNAAAFLGDDSPLISAGTFNRSYLTSQTELLTTMYRESWLAMRIIDMPSEDMTRAWYKLSSEMDEDDLNALRRLEAKHSIKQEIANAIRWARLYGGPPLRGCYRRHCDSRPGRYARPTAGSERRRTG